MPNSILLQATTIAQITQSTNELTRNSSSQLANKCYQLTLALYSIARTIPFEDVQLISSQLIQCSSNILSAINGPIQQRTLVLDSDFSQANTISSDYYDTDLEYVWSNISI